MNFLLLGVVGPWQFAIIIAVILLLFGGKKIPELMKGIGQGINEFKKARQTDGAKKEAVEGEAVKTEK